MKILLSSEDNHKALIVQQVFEREIDTNPNLNGEKLEIETGDFTCIEGLEHDAYLGAHCMSLLMDITD